MQFMLLVLLQLTFLRRIQRQRAAIALFAYFTSTLYLYCSFCYYSVSAAESATVAVAGTAACCRADTTEVK